MFFFFFQAEDGIRDYKVTGVQTCALPISFQLVAASAEWDARGGAMHLAGRVTGSAQEALAWLRQHPQLSAYAPGLQDVDRSEERRVGEECRSRWSPYH